MSHSTVLSQNISEGSLVQLRADVQERPRSKHATPHIRTNGLSIAYHGKRALKDVSLEIHKGCITALIGPSGCGKTSFLSSLNRLTDLTPGCTVNGNIQVNGHDIHSVATDVRALRQDVGMIFQRPNPFPLSIRNNLAMPLKEYGIRKPSEIDEKIEKALSDVGLWNEVRDKLDSSALRLSGGQQQRLCIARALTLNPSVLLMDEPCSALDPISSTVIEELIESLLPKYTVVIVTHNLAQAKRISQYSAFFWTHDNVGTVIESGQTEKIFDTPKHNLTASYISGSRG